MAGKKKTPHPKTGAATEFPVGFRFGPGDQYEIRDASELHANSPPGSVGSIAKPLGRGGAGQVYFVLQNGRIKRAVKILAPLPELAKDSAQQSLFKRTFEKEISCLINIRHPNISGIVDFGELRQPGGILQQYYVMDLVVGMTLDRFISAAQPPLDLRTLRDLLVDLFSALGYLHGQPEAVMHCDIKEANVLIEAREGDRPRLRLVDLGVAHIKSDESTKTLFAGTRRRLPKELQDLLGDRPYVEIPRSQLSPWFPKLDLHLAGEMLNALFFAEQALVPEEVRDAIHSEIGNAWGFLEALTSRLRLRAKPDPRVPLLKNAHAVLDELRKLDPEFRDPFGVVELGLAGRGYKSIAMPRGRVVLTKRLHSLVDHPLFQRLRELNQLNFLYFVYPGARHSRLLHSLRAYDLAREYLASLLSEQSFVQVIAPPDIEAVLIWALLHDVGHYPLSHMWEGFCSKRSTEEVAKGGPAKDDELLPIVISAGSGDGFRRFEGATTEAIEGAVEAAGLHLPSLLQTVADEFGSATAATLENLIVGATDDVQRSRLRLLRTIVDGAIDVDKLSYLELDAFHSGAPYGGTIDHDAILSSLTVAEKNGSLVLAIRTKALPAIESMMAARGWMFSRVYWHKFNRSIMAMFRRAIAVLLHQEQPLLFERYLRETWFASDVAATRLLAQNYRDVTGSDLLMRLLDGRRRVHKRVLALSASDLARRTGWAEVHWEDLTERVSDCHKACTFETELGRHVAAALGVPNLADDAILIDLPREKRSPQDNLHVLDGNGVHELRNYSEIVEALERQYNSRLRRFRVFADPGLIEEHGEEEMVRTVERALSEMLGVRG